MFAQSFDISDQMRGGVVAGFSQRRRAPGAELVKNDSAVEPRVEKTPVCRAGPRTWTTMQKQYRDAMRIAADFPIHFVKRVQRQAAGAEGFQMRIYLGAYRGFQWRIH